MFTNNNIAAYYDTTQNHYKKWWKLKQTRALHYGIWQKGTQNFAEALINTNKVLLEKGQIDKSSTVLDAGCGIGGSSIFIAKKSQAKVIGISLSEKQVRQANAFAQNEGLSDKVRFKTMDFTATEFADESFDVVWACESVCHANNKADFIRETFRILKKGGRLILADFFLCSNNQKDKKQWIKKWCDTWSVPNLITSNEFFDIAKTIGFGKHEETDYTKEIYKSSKRLYLASLVGALPSETYNLLHPNVTPFAKTHYKCGYFQFKALKAELWRYKVVLLNK